MHEQNKLLLHCLFTFLKSGKQDADCQFQTLLRLLHDAANRTTQTGIHEVLIAMTFLWSAKDLNAPHSTCEYQNTKAKLNELCNGILSKSWTVFPVLVRLDAAIVACVQRDATDATMTTLPQKLIQALHTTPTLLPDGSKDDLNKFISDCGHGWATLRSLFSESSEKWKATGTKQLKWCEEKLMALSEQVVVRQTTTFWTSLSPVLSQLAEALIADDDASTSEISARLAPIAKSTGCLMSDACKTVFQESQWQVLRH